MYSNTCFMLTLGIPWLLGLGRLPYSTGRLALLAPRQMTGGTLRRHSGSIHRVSASTRSVVTTWCESTSTEHEGG